MSINLVSAKIFGQAVQGTQRVTHADTSIAEDAKFITKPVKRVKFEVVRGSGLNTELKLPGQNNGSPSIPFLGQSSSVGAADENIIAGSLDKNGITARFNAGSYSGGGGGGGGAKVEMVINNSPQKDFSFAPTQEEGRQTNHAGTTHYSQQYDLYGQPIIGFSRESYDFAATKHIAKTSQTKFKQNVQNTNKQLISDKSAMPDTVIAGSNNTANTMVAPPEADLRLFGEKLEKNGVKLKPIVPDKYFGEKIKPEGGKVATGDEAKNIPPQNNESEITKVLGIDFTKVLHPDNSTQASQAHNIKQGDNSASISLNA